MYMWKQVKSEFFRIHSMGMHVLHMYWCTVWNSLILLSPFLFFISYFLLRVRVSLTTHTSVKMWWHVCYEPSNDIINKVKSCMQNSSYFISFYDLINEMGDINLKQFTVLWGWIERKPQPFYFPRYCFPHMLGMKTMSLALCCSAASFEIWCSCWSLTFPCGRTFSRPLR